MNRWKRAAACGYKGATARQRDTPRGSWYRPTLASAHAILLAACSGTPAFTIGEVEFRGPPGSSAPNLAVDGNRVVLSWLEPTGDGRHAVRVAVRHGENAWRPARTAVENDSLFVNWADFPSVRPIGGDRWMVHWLQKMAPGTYAYHAMAALSDDYGATWGAPFVVHADRSPTEHGFVSIVPWSDGAALIWLDGRFTGGHGAAGDGEAGAMTLRFTTIAADGSPATDIELDGRVCDCCQTDLVRTASGLLAVFRDRTAGEIRDIAALRHVDGAWSEPVPVSRDGWHYVGCPVNGPAVAAEGDTAVVAWFTAAHDTSRVFVAYSYDGGASFGTPLRIDDGRPVGRVDVVSLGAGAAAVVWLEDVDTGGAIRIRRVHDGEAGPAQSVTETSTARAAGFPRLVRAGGSLVLTWTDPSAAGGVRVLSIAMGG